MIHDERDGHEADTQTLVTLTSAKSDGFTILGGTERYQVKIGLRAPEAAFALSHLFQDVGVRLAAAQDAVREPDS